jgi:uncharacterized protein (DUF427 family)
MENRAMQVEPSPKRVRAFRAGALIVDSTNVLLVWEHKYFPQYYVPVTDVVADVAIDATTSTDERLRDYVHIKWNAMDAWFEEDEEVFVHPRSPYARVDILPSSRHVQVEVDGVIVADSVHASLLLETGLPARWYIPKVDVRMDLLEPTDTVTQCPYKGTARYWSARLPSGIATDIAWSYPTPLPESERIAGLICFYNERVDITVDGVRQERPTTKFS